MGKVAKVVRRVVLEHVIYSDAHRHIATLESVKQAVHQEIWTGHYRFAITYGALDRATESALRALCKQGVLKQTLVHQDGQPPYDHYHQFTSPVVVNAN